MKKAFTSVEMDPAHQYSRHSGKVFTRLWPYDTQYSVRGQCQVQPPRAPLAAPTGEKRLFKANILYGNQETFCRQRKCAYTVGFPHGGYGQISPTLGAADDCGWPMNEDPKQILWEEGPGVTVYGNPNKFQSLYELEESPSPLDDGCPYITGATIHHDPRGAWDFGGETWNLYDVYRCHRVFIYRDITHNGTQYDSSKLRNEPTYKLRKKANSVGQFDTRFEPWGWRPNSLSFDDYYAVCGAGHPLGDGAQIPAPPGITFPVSPPVTGLPDIEAKLGGRQVFWGLACGIGDALNNTDFMDRFLSVLPADLEHDLVLSMSVYYWRRKKQQICTGAVKPPPKNAFGTGWRYTCGWEPPTHFEFYNIYGEANVYV